MNSTISTKMNFLLKWTLFLAMPAMLLVTSCSKDDDPFVRVTVNGTQLNTSPSDFTIGDRSDFNGDIDASFTGNGGTAMQGVSR